jgi:hypothetical protein
MPSKQSLNKAYYVWVEQREHNSLEKFKTYTHLYLIHSDEKYKSKASYWKNRLVRLINLRSKIKNYKKCGERCSCSKNS